MDYFILGLFVKGQHDTSNLNVISTNQIKG